MSNDTTNWLSNNRGNTGDGVGVYFGTVGQKVVGEIISTPKKVDTQYGERLVVELRCREDSTALKGKEGADGPIQGSDEVSLWIKPGPMASALADAIAAAGAKGLTEGDTIAVAFSGEQDTGKPSKLKLYTAQLVPVKPTVSVDSLV